MFVNFIRVDFSNTREAEAEKHRRFDSKWLLKLALKLSGSFRKSLTFLHLRCSLHSNDIEWPGESSLKEVTRPDHGLTRRGLTVFRFGERTTVANEIQRQKHLI